jgi:oligoribonuclease NrnB/cAMP/cGMP phosphodiesterase (DHH superfamily)
MPPKTIVIYHGNCVDGFTAAWVVWLIKGDDAEYHAAGYGNEPPDVKGREVIIVDFSYPRDIMLRMIDEADSLLCLDHHKTAEAALVDLPGCTFDMTRSGAVMAWHYFHRGDEVPLFALYVEDHDLWHKQMRDTDAIGAAIRSHPFTFSAWSNLSYYVGNEKYCDGLAKEGWAIRRYQQQSILNHVERARPQVLVDGDEPIPVVNCTDSSILSDLGHRLCQSFSSPYSATFMDNDGQRTYSLRSLEDGADVSEIAKSQGGGGHKHAAGFRRSIVAT